jgi:hypothetical protein
MLSLALKKANGSNGKRQARISINTTMLGKEKESKHFSPSSGYYHKGLGLSQGRVGARGQRYT